MILIKVLIIPVNGTEICLQPLSTDVHLLQNIKTKWKLMRHYLLLGKFMRYRFIALFTLTLFCFAQSQQVTQIPITSLLNIRSVTTFTNGNLVTWSLGGGVDHGNGLFTSAAAIFTGDTAVLALPDSSLIFANARHPDILLHYSNNDGVGFQTRGIDDTGSFSISLSAGNYSKIFLTFTSAFGQSDLQFQLNYKDTTETKSVTLPDWYYFISNSDSVCFNLLSNLARWDHNNIPAAISGSGHNNIDGIELHPMVNKTLVSIKVIKVKTPNMPSILTFWAATGVTVSLPATVVLARLADTVKTDSVKLLWRKAMPLVDKYRLELSLDSLFSKVQMDSNVTDTLRTVKVTVLSGSLGLFWRVRAHNVLGWGPVSATGKLILSSPTTAISRQKPFLQKFAISEELLHFTLAKSENVRIDLFDMHGHRIVLLDGMLAAGEHHLALPTKNLSLGLYIVTLHSEGFQQSLKIIKP